MSLTGWSKKKTLPFVFSVKFVVFNIFSTFLHYIVAEYQEILPCKFQVCTTKTVSAAFIDSQISAFEKRAKCALWSAGQGSP